ncbi:MAG: hypothetical protein J1E83_14650 [Lachnospiraceae bacterium]|nr:hypothetical protein [Lachnospiraceae bacterium]
MRKVIKNMILLLLILSLSISTAFLIYLHFFKSDGRSLSGEWTAELNLTEQAAATAFIWLQDIEGVSVSFQDVESGMQKLTVQVVLNLEATTGSEGAFHCSILPESYNMCEQAAYEAFAAIFRELLAERLRMAGYTGDTDKDDLEALVTETFGMSTVSYLMTYGPALLPSLEDLQARYEGSGTYEAAEGILTRRYDNGTVKTENYVWDNSGLVLAEEEDSDGQGQMKTEILIFRKK